ncbi:endothelin-converting enzyme 1 [Coprinopsis marcescibilis]|uniref:Endothelin-converting enzyme 1 n=1 Tax=Coprinopsis marcescibilis TaxID=230819 RepID=A0A5C3LAC3_COPMA|nr:endothelin-converting enzyme 1 [Coprinopsis marcescibilis]
MVCVLGLHCSRDTQLLCQPTERSSLLQDSDSEAGPSRDGHRNNVTFQERVNAVATEPLTPLSKILLVLSLVLLLLSSVFIGLFAGAQHKLKVGHPGEPGQDTITSTITATRTMVTTTTSKRVSTTSVTTTATVTTTVSAPPLPGPTFPPHERPCMEPHCVIEAAAILSSLDVTKDPCENFYDFANGGWLKAHPLPADKDSFGNFEALAQQNKQLVQQLIEDKSYTVEFTGDADQELLRKLRNQYNSCLNENNLNGIGEKPLRHFIKTIRKLYREEDTDVTSKLFSSLREEGEEEKPVFKFNGLTAATAYLHSRGIPALFSFDIEGDVGKDPNFMVLWFSQPELGLPSKEYYEEKSIRTVYRSVVEDLLVRVVDILADGDDDDDDKEEKPEEKQLIDNSDSQVWPPWPWPGGGDPDKDPSTPSNGTERAKELAKGVIKFERKLAKASLDLDVLYQDPIATYNPVPLSNLTDTLHMFDFPTYFSEFTPRSYPDRVVLTYPSYAASLADILNDTSSDVIEAYLVSRALLSLSSYLGPETELWQAQRTLYETLSGIKKGAVGDRAEYCVSKVEETLGFAAGRFFVKEAFGGDSKAKATKLIENVVKAFKASLPHIDWMDGKSAKAAAEKADAIRIKVGYPEYPKTTDPDSILRYYNGVNIDRNRFFENMLSSSASDVFKKWLQLGKQRNFESWEMFPTTVNAYFNPPSNEIVFPAGILQPPFFSHGWPGYMSYGAFGQVASHELTHAFDSAGRLYNQNGKLEQWWTNTTSEGFNKKQKCIVDQYSKYTIDDGKGSKIPVNNIGDSGLIQAYRAWKAQFDSALENGTEYLLPGISYTREQLFFISFARIWARAMKPAAAVRRIRTDPHSPTRYRVDGTLSNIPEFAKVFNCRQGSKLNPPPEDRCVFWG